MITSKEIHYVEVVEDGDQIVLGDTVDTAIADKHYYCDACGHEFDELIRKQVEVDEL